MIGDVPCNSCTLCCQGGAVKEYPSHLLHGCSGLGRHVLDIIASADPNQACPFLESNGCSIHDHKPHVCRIMDCRVLASAYDRGDWRVSDAVWDRGNELLEKK